MPEITWNAKPHTIAKHKILEAYLKAWIAILSSQTAKHPDANKVIRYVDGFAGPGIYKDGEPGSPVLALQIALEHSQELPTPVEFTFIERDKAHFVSLQAEVNKLQEQAKASPRIGEVHLHHGDCKKFIPKIIHKPKDESFGPALFFLDQFGYAEIPMDLVRQILEIKMCEVFFFLHWRDLNRFMTDKKKHRAITVAFGGDEWEKCTSLKDPARRTKFLELYMRALRDRGGAKYVLDFAMQGEGDVFLSWLFFCTNNLRGLEEMKKAMWKMDDTGAFRFSDKDDPDQMLLLRSFDDDWLAKELGKRLVGKTMTVGEIRAYVLDNIKPCYLYKKALTILELKRELQVLGAPPNRRKGSFPDENMRVLFTRSPDSGNLFNRPNY